MSERITRRDVEARALIVARLADELGLAPGEDYMLGVAAGSATYGRAWRLHWLRKDNGGLRDAFGLSGGYLGMNAREAYQTLSGIIGALREVECAKQKAGAL